MTEHEAPRCATSWHDGTVESVAPGVHRIPLPLPADGLRGVNVYALAHEERLTLIDAGWALDESFALLEDALGGLGFGFEQVDRILVTHMHRDHYTMAVRVRRLFGTRIEIGVGERESLEQLSAGHFDGQLDHLSTWGAEALRPRLDTQLRPESYELPDGWIEPEAELLAGGRLLRALPTPGHTQGHLVFADLEAGLLFSGDHVLPTITPSIGFESVRATQPLNDYLISLALVAALPDLTVLPAHGPPGGSSHRRVAELERHHEARLMATRDVLRHRNASAYDVAGLLTWTRHERGFDALDPTNQLLAVGETAAHLDLLTLDGSVVRELEPGGRAVYSIGAPTCETETSTTGGAL